MLTRRHVKVLPVGSSLRLLPFGGDSLSPHVTLLTIKFECLQPDTGGHAICDDGSGYSQYKRLSVAVDNLKPNCLYYLHMINNPILKLLSFQLMGETITTENSLASQWLPVVEPWSSLWIVGNMRRTHGILASLTPLSRAISAAVNRIFR
jgi:hypothetical protein